MDIDPAQDSLTNLVVGAAFEVSNVLGHGFLEVIYRRALVKELRLRGVDVQEEVRLPVSYKGDEIGVYQADLVVADCVVVELKAVEKLAQAHVGQVLNYLRASGLRVGMLLNFGQPKVEFRRVLL